MEAGRGWMSGEVVLGGGSLLGGRGECEVR